MNEIFLSSAIENAHFVLPRLLKRVSQGPFQRIDEIHQICDHYRKLGVTTMFVEGNSDGYHLRTMQSAALYLHELSRQSDQAKVTSFIQPWFDAVGSGYWDAARLITEASRPTHNPDREYEDDFLYAWFLMQQWGLETPRPDNERLLERYAKVLGGAQDIRLDICRALHCGNALDFDNALSILLEKQRVDTCELIRQKAINGDPESWWPHFTVEALALLSIAEREGLSTTPHDLHCPDVVRGGSPYIFDRDSWMRVDFQPQHRT